MKLALIAPLSLLETQTTDYQLVLPHLFMNEDYCEFVATCNDDVYTHDYVILDNGAAEQAGEQVDAFGLLCMCEDFPINELAVPDVLGDSDATYQEIAKFFSQNERQIVEVQHKRFDVGWPPLQFGFVAQGKTLEQARDLIHRVMSSRFATFFSTVYIPRLLIKESGDEQVRIKLAHRIEETYGDRLQIHMFGCSHLFPREIWYVAKYCPFVRSIDTSLPYSATFHSMSLMQSPSIFGARQEAFIRPKDYFSLPKEKFDPELLEFNLKVFKGWANGQT